MNKGGHKEIPLFKVFMSSSMDRALSETINSGFIGQGPKVEQFEDRLKEWFETKFLATVNSGTSAIHLALHLLKNEFTEVVEGGSRNTWPGMEEGDEVLATPLTCLATNMPIIANGFKIKWVDVDPETLNMNLVDLEKKITTRTKAIIVVHWGGYPVDLDELKKIQERVQKRIGFKPAIIEDCAHAFGARYKGKLIGTHGNICAFSFQAIKHITTGDGGMLILPHEQLYKRAKLLRWYGIDRDNPKTAMRCEDDVPEIGFKFHMNDINATIGIENLQYAVYIVERHTKNSAAYDKKLSGILGLTILKRDPWVLSSCWIYTMLVEERDAFILHLKKNGIAASPVHQRNDHHSCFERFRSNLPGLDSIANKMVCIPVHWDLADYQFNKIVSTIKNGWQHESSRNGRAL